MPRPDPQWANKTRAVNQTGGATLTIAKPTGLTDGDFLVFAVREQNATVGDYTNSHGFTRISATYVQDNNVRLISVWGKFVTNAAAEPANYTFSLTGGGRYVAEMFAVKNVDPTTPVAGFSAFGGTAITNGRRAEAVTFTADRAMLALFVAGREATANQGTSPTTSPSGWTLVTDTDTGGPVTGSRTTFHMYSRAYDASPTDAASITWAATVTGPHAQVVVLRGTSDAPPAHDAGPGYAALDGNGDAAKVYVTNDAGLPVTPTALVPMYRGFSTVDEMLATPGFTMAHRGNSTRYAEMSLYAYTQSARLGYGVMEVSLGRTSDGVFVGLHDDDINRTSGVTGQPAISSMTWAQVQTFNNVLGSQGAPRPYMSLDQYISAYGDSHVTMFDPKSINLTGRQALYAKLNAEVGPERAIIKSYGDSAHIGLEARAAGLFSWGFFYAVNIGTGILASDHSSWDSLGLEYNASQADWDTLLGYAGSRITIAHVIPTQANYDTAMSRGAFGAQVSASHLVRPVSWWT